MCEKATRPQAARTSAQYMTHYYIFKSSQEKANFSVRTDTFKTNYHHTVTEVDTSELGLLLPSSSAAAASFFRRKIYSMRSL